MSSLSPDVTISLIFPMAEFLPMLMITMCPVPQVTLVPAKITGLGIEVWVIFSTPQPSNSIFLLKQNSKFYLFIGFVSPVIEDSSMVIEYPFISTPSPGTSIPCLRKIMSPTSMSPTRRLSDSIPFLMTVIYFPLIILLFSFWNSFSFFLLLKA